VYGFSLVHYFFWAIPILALFSWLSIRKIREIGWRVAVPGLAIPIALAWCVRLEEVDSTRARVRDDGTVKAIDAAEGAYDLMIIRGRHQGDAPMLEVDGRELRLGNDFHMRRDYEQMTSLGGYAVHFADPVKLDEVVFMSDSMRGHDVEFRRLKWSLTSVPPMVAKDRGDRLWGVDRLDESRTWAASELPGAVGRVDERAKTRRTDGHAGHLQFGPYIRLAPGTYEVVWYGRMTERGNAAVDVLAKKGKLRVKEAEPVHVHGRELARIRFELDQPTKQVEFRLYVDDQVDILLRQVELRPVLP
jgi:hypothetical protein